MGLNVDLPDDFSENYYGETLERFQVITDNFTKYIVYFGSKIKNVTQVKFFLTFTENIWQTNGVSEHIVSESQGIEEKIESNHQ